MVLHDFVKIQNQIKKDIHRELVENNIQRTINLLDCYADCTQRINNILRDDEVEDVIKYVSVNYIDSTIDIMNGGAHGTVVFYDNIGTTICLGVQYLRGLADNGYRVIYIYDGIAAINCHMLEEVKKFTKEYYLFDSKRVVERGVFMGQKIRDIIVKANPSKIIAHFQATGALDVSVLYSIKGAKKIRIVPGDHHFYLGYDCFDYFIEFRPFGWSTALFERKIPSERIYSLSYYPLIDEFVSFNGLPSGTKGKIVLASGGAAYKFQGSNCFYDMVETILHENENAVFVFMGRPSPQMVQLSQKENMNGRVFLLGYRMDFVAIMKRIDILINSFPFSGGLFCQTAAFFSKPILAYTEYGDKEDNSVDDILGAHFGSPDCIEKYSLGDFYDHAHNLIEFAEYRRYWGEIAHNKLQTKDQFEVGLKQILEGSYPTIKGLNVKQIDRTPRINRYMKIRNENEPDYLMPLARLLKVRVLRYCFVSPKCILPNLKYVIYHILASYRRLLLDSLKLSLIIL